MRFKKVVIIFLLSSVHAFAQKTKPSDSFIISGDVKNEISVAFKDLSKFNQHHIGNVVITNHLGEAKGEAKALKGVLLKEVLQSVQLKSESPKEYSRFYFVCKGNDGYTVVYSWNEIFNSPSGDEMYLVTGKDGKSEMDEAILMISPKDFKTGRRYLKALVSIQAKRV